MHEGWSLSICEDWAMPDQLVSTTVTALLKIASGHPEHRDGAFRAIVALVTEIVKRFKTADRTRVHHLPTSAYTYKSI